MTFDVWQRERGKERKKARQVTCTEEKTRTHGGLVTRVTEWYVTCTGPSTWIHETSMAWWSTTCHESGKSGCCHTYRRRVWSRGRRVSQLTLLSVRQNGSSFRSCTFICTDSLMLNRCKRTLYYSTQHGWSFHLPSRLMFTWRHFWSRQNYKSDSKKTRSTLRSVFRALLTWHWFLLLKWEKKSVCEDNRAIEINLPRDIDDARLIFFTTKSQVSSNTALEETPGQRKTSGNNRPSNQGADESDQRPG